MQQYLLNLLHDRQTQSQQPVSNLPTFLLTNFLFSPKTSSSYPQKIFQITFLSHTVTFLSGGGGVAQLATRRLAVRQARVRFSARHHREVFPTEHTSDEEMERGFSECRRMNVLLLNECMYVIKKKYENKQKEWHPDTSFPSFFHTDPLGYSCLLIGNSFNYISFPCNSPACVSFKYSHVTEFMYCTVSLE